jgi:hypothetical protein
VISRVVREDLEQVVANGAASLDEALQFGGVVLMCWATFWHGTRTKGTPQSKIKREAIRSWLRLNSCVVCQYVGCPPSHTTTMRSMMSGASAIAEAMLVMALMHTTYSGPSRSWRARVMRSSTASERTPIFRAFHPAARALEHKVLRRLVHPFEDAEDFLVRLFHAVLGAARALVVERRGVDGFEADSLGREQGVDKRELIVDLVEGVGVQHDVDRARRRREPRQAKRVRQKRELHAPLLTRRAARASTRRPKYFKYF